MTAITPKLNAWSVPFPPVAISVAVPASTEQITYEDLYARWERGNWRAMEIDFSQDRIDWHERMTDEQRRGALWLYTLFFHGEDSVTDNLSPYIDAAPLEEQKYFLTTQQVDEARHAVFFKRFMEEVVGAGSGSIASVLASTESLLSWGHRRLFGRLDEMADELRKDRSPRKLTEAITLYHIIIEASAAQPGQHMIDTSLERLDMMPGFRSGMVNVALDEQRHIAFGVRLLADQLKARPEETQDAIVHTIRDCLPYATALAWPPNGDRSYTECLGFSVEDLFEEGARAQESRLRAIGLKIDQIERFPLPLDQSPRQRAERGTKLLEAGFLGEKHGPPRRDPEAIAILFDSAARVADARSVADGTTIQWDFDDADPWYLTLNNGSTSVTQGRATKPDVTLRMSFEDFVDLTAKRIEPGRLLLTRRLRPKGKLRLMAKLSAIFG